MNSTIKSQLVGVSICIGMIMLGGANALGCASSDPFDYPALKLSSYNLKLTEKQAAEKICPTSSWMVPAEYLFYESPSLYAKSLGDLVLVCKIRDEKSPNEEPWFSGDYHVIKSRESLKEVEMFGPFNSMKVFADRNTKYIDYVSNGVYIQDLISVEYSSKNPNGVRDVVVLRATKKKNKIKYKEIKLGEIELELAAGCALSAIPTYEYKFNETTGDITVTLDFDGTGLRVEKNKRILTISYNKDKQEYQKVCASDKLDGCPL